MDDHARVSKGSILIGTPLPANGFLLNRVPMKENRDLLLAFSKPKRSCRHTIPTTRNKSLN